MGKTESLTITPYDYHGINYKEQTVWVDAKYKHPDPSRVMIWGYGEVDDTVSDFSRAFTKSGKAITLEYNVPRFTTANQEKAIRANTIREYIGATKMEKGGGVKKISSPSDIKSNTYLSIEGAMYYYPEQEIPIHTNYSGGEKFIADHDVLFATAPNNYNLDVEKGDELFFIVESPANGDPDSANSYKLVNSTKRKYYPILDLIPPTAEGGRLNDDLHYDAITQIKNVGKIYNGELETRKQYKTREAKIYKDILARDNPKFFARPRHTRGFEIISLEEIKESFGYTIEDWLPEFLLANAYVPIPSKKTNEKKIDELWDMFYDMIEVKTIEAYRGKMQKGGEVKPFWGDIDWLITGNLL